jgi:hypothetical protein
MKLRQLVLAALLLALAFIFQSLRFILPAPPVFTTFLIGSLVNSCILIAVERASLSGAIMIAIVTPLMAYVQQLLLLPLFIVPVALGNSLFAVVYWLLRKRRTWVRIGVAAATKGILMYSCFAVLLSLLALPEQASKAILFVMSWPQFVTAVVGGLIAYAVNKRLPSRS